VKPIPGVTEVWASVQAYAKKLGVRYVPLGSHHKLRMKPLDLEKQYDFSALMYWNGRRQPLKAQIERAGFTIAPNAWGWERDKLLNQSRAMLHLHQWDAYPYAAPLRWAIAAAYKLLVFCENGEIEQFYQLHNKQITPLNLNNEFIKFSLDYHLMEERGEAFHQWLCHEMNFRTLVEAAV
jgi:hypothetical protein